MESIMSKRLKESKEYFAEVAQDWDHMRASYFTEQMRDDAGARADLSPTDVVADVGTGTGFVIQGLAGLVNKIYGFDESPEMLGIARKNVAAFKNVELIEARGDHPPLPDESLDAVFANMYLHDTMDPPAAIAEMSRLLKHGGKLVLTDVDVHNQAWMREAMADRWLGFKREDIRDWLEAAGLVRISVNYARGNCCAETEDGRRIALSVFIAVGEKP